MLKRIRIKNFQCHRRLDLDVAAPVSVITGASDVGKSAIARALRWLLLNSFSGTGFITQGETECMVSAEFDDFTVIRRRTPSKNVYRLVHEDEEGRRLVQDFVSFGNTVPAPIARALKMDSENIQSQHDAPFWLSLSDTQAAAQLNSIVRLDIIDRAMSKLLAGKNRASTARYSAQDRQSEISNALADLKPLAPGRLSDLQERLKRHSPASQIRLAEILAGLEKSRETTSQASRIRKIRQELAALENKGRKVNASGIRVHRLDTLIAKIETRELAHEVLTKELAEVRKQISTIRVCPECQRPL